MPLNRAFSFCQTPTRSSAFPCISEALAHEFWLLSALLVRFLEFTAAFATLCSHDQIHASLPFFEVSVQFLPIESIRVFGRYPEAADPQSQVLAHEPFFPF
jgi:hypothetical protein